MISVFELLRFLRTVRYLKPGQVFHQVLYRLRVLPPRRAAAFAGPPPPSRAQKELPRHFLKAYGAIRDAGWQFSFLNHKKSFPAGSIEWRVDDVSKLWRYNLHYFDFLQSTKLDESAKAELIESWIDGNPPGVADAWDAYPVSMRIINWVKYFLSRPAESVPPLWCSSLANQARWLERRIEFHILGNHLFKNAVALVFAGVWFAGEEGDRWLRKGCGLLREQIPEQFLPDGGHFERSPMYHAICTTDCLDLINLLKGNSNSEAVAVLHELIEVIGPALSFLRDMTLPDGGLALFNDSAHGIAPSPAEINDYACRVLPAKSIKMEPTQRMTEICRASCGYFGYRDSNEGLLIDCGSIGPDYQPGHAHCDTLSFEWVLNGDRIVVDAGTFDYEAGVRRQYARGTRGHNTLMVDGEEQSEIWGVFRVARRARASLLRCEWHDEGFVFEGGHDGYQRLKGKPYVTRKLMRTRPGELVIEDSVEGEGWHRADSRLHFRPGLRVVMNDSHAEVLDEGGRPRLLVTFIGSPGVFLVEGEYYPEFGIAKPAPELVLSVAGALPLSVGYKLKAIMPV